MSDCIFCDIAQKTARAQIVLENDDFVAFENISPRAPVHILVIPKEHLDKKDAISGKSPQFWDNMMEFVNEVIKKFELDKTGYRLVNNGAGFHAIDHEHIHVMGGQSWKPKDNL